MRIARFGPGAEAGDVRALAPPRADVAPAVAEIVERVRTGGDAAVRALTERFDRADVAPESPVVTPDEIERSVGALPPEVLRGLRTAIANVRAVAEAQLGEATDVTLEAGQRIELLDLPVRRAGVYVPGGRAPYPSSLVMCAVTARAAGVEEIAVCAPPGPGGRAHPLILAACCLCGVTEVHRMGGAQAIAALALGTESVRPVDVVVGPGNAYVQEAKRQLAGAVGIDAVAGPSELVVVAGRGADPELAALDLLAQAEHGPDSLVALISSDRDAVAAVERAVERALPGSPSVAKAPLALVRERDAAAAVALADAIAPEHLELVGADVEELAGRVRNAGCLLVGRGAATAFSDYVAGSNHVLPTGGAARFQGGLSVSTFRRRMSRVSVPDEAASRLAGPGAALARAEGFPVHAESMERRARGAEPEARVPAEPLERGS